MIGAADDDRDTAVAQSRENGGGPRDAVGMDNKGADIVECDAAAFLIAGGHGQEAAMHGKEKIVGFYVDYALHGGKRSLLFVDDQY